MSTPGNPFSLVVTGDVIIDHHLYEGKRDTPAKDETAGLRDICEDGGAEILAEMLKEVFKTKNPEWSAHCGNAGPGVLDKPGGQLVGEKSSGHHAYAFWSPHLKSKDEKKKKENEQTKVWRVKVPMGYWRRPEPFGSAENPSPVYYLPSSAPPNPNILVIDDAGFGFRHQVNQKCWLLPGDGEHVPQWIILKMSQPIAHGDLWHELISRFAETLVCVVGADELREECVDISHGLSWERTIEDLCDALSASSALAALARCRHLIVRFAADGALWLDRTSSESKATLIFDAGGAEGGWREKRDGTVFGASATLTAAVASGFARAISDAAVPKVRDKNKEEDENAVVAAIKAGLHAIRELEKDGHGVKGPALPNGFPVQHIADSIARPKTDFANAAIPWPIPRKGQPTADQEWMIVETSLRPKGYAVRPPLVGLARQVVLRGEPALTAYPHARFGKLITIDRLEIEMLRSLRRLMVAYDKQERAEKPLSIGVFGPPGAGKSFGVKQIAKEVFGDEAWIDFNLSQFNGAIDLVGALHQVRDKVLSGTTPVVFWDEFDSKEYFWLQYLLAPMQDGRFQEGQVSHWIGKCVFVFAGGTSPTFAEFPPPGGAPDQVVRDYKLKKGPDFHSRLDGYYDVVGPNRRALPRTTWQPNAAPDSDPADICFPLRRALMIRALLDCKDDERLDFDSNLLDALLLVPAFRHGARSLEKMISGLRPKGGDPLRRSAMPAPTLRAMHVDERAFNALLKRDDSFLMSDEIEGLADQIHGFWRDLSQKEGWPMQAYLDKAYDELAPIDKEDNRAAARRIPRILSLVGLGLAKSTTTSSSSDEPTDQYLEQYLGQLPHVEVLAEAEHDGWTEHRLANGWRLGVPRNDEKRIHDLLKPYSTLDWKAKEKDRNTIRHIPAMVSRAGYRIVWLRS